MSETLGWLVLTPPEQYQLLVLANQFCSLACSLLASDEKDEEKEYCEPRQKVAENCALLQKIDSAAPPEQFRGFVQLLGSLPSKPRKVGAVMATQLSGRCMIAARALIFCALKATICKPEDATESSRQEPPTPPLRLH